MTTLRKDITTEIIPGNPGVPATSGCPARPAYCATEYTKRLYGAVYVYNPGNEIGTGVHTTPEMRWTTVLEPVEVCHPAVPAIAGSAGVPPTVQQISVSLNSGWNSSARSIDHIPHGNFVQYSVAPGAGGVFLGLGVAGKDRQAIGAFSHGLLADLSGVWVYEAGATMIRLSLTFDGTEKLRITRQADGSIVYLLVKGSQTVAHTSAVPGLNAPLYVYGYLYSGGDSVNSADIITGEVQYGSA